MQGSYGGNTLSKIQEIESTHGYGTWADTQYTASTPLVIPTGQRVQLLNNGLGGDRSQMPNDTVTFYDATGNKIVTDKVGNEYTLRISFQAFTSSNTGYGEIDMEIGAELPILTLPVNFPRGNGVNNLRPQTLDSKYFTGDLFLANGAELYYESVRGNTTLYGLTYYISRIKKGK